MIRIDITKLPTDPKIKEKYKNLTTAINDVLSGFNTGESEFVQKMMCVCLKNLYKDLLNGSQGILSFPYGTTIEDILLELEIVVTNSHVRRLVHQGAITVVREGEAPVKPASSVEPLEAGRIELKIAKSKLIKLLIKKESRD